MSFCSNEAAAPVVAIQVRLPVASVPLAPLVIVPFEALRTSDPLDCVNADPLRTMFPLFDWNVAVPAPPIRATPSTTMSLFSVAIVILPAPVTVALSTDTPSPSVMLMVPATVLTFSRLAKRLGMLTLVVADSSALPAPRLSALVAVMEPLAALAVRLSALLLRWIVPVIATLLSASSNRVPPVVITRFAATLRLPALDSRSVFALPPREKAP